MQRYGAALATSWNDSKKERKGRLLSLLVASVLTLTVLSPPMRASVSEAAHRMVSVIVRATPGGGPDVRDAVEDAGGTVARRIRIIRGFIARVPAAALGALALHPSIEAITPDRPVRFHTTDYDPTQDEFSMHRTARAIWVHDYWRNGYTGEGVDVAVIDTGVAPVEGLDEPGKIVNGPDLSFDSQQPELRYLDAYGHGTHIAGIIAGRDDAVPPGEELGADDEFLGIAPDARIVNVKVGDLEGAVDVSQVIAAIDWVVQHRHDDGLDIRVLNLSFGTDGVQDYVLDPLAHAAEVAWHKGIVVVAAAGNTGFGNGQLSNPAYDPYVLAVGADDPRGLGTTRDDRIPDWSSRGGSGRHPDLIAPGRSLQSLRVPGSYVDDQHPEGRLDERFTRGSGTSQSAAVVSGAVALLLEQRPEMTPDQVKALLTGTAVPLPRQDDLSQGAGLINMGMAYAAPTPVAEQTHPRSAGTGSLESARGSLHLVDADGSELRGEVDIFGTPWDATGWSAGAENETTWSGGSWNGVEWSGEGWTGTSWAGKAWAGKAWALSTWSGKAWAEGTWTGKAWAGKAWAGKAWAGKAWAGKAWAGSDWSGAAWGGKAWAGAGWG